MATSLLRALACVSALTTLHSLIASPQARLEKALPAADPFPPEDSAITVGGKHAAAVGARAAAPRTEMHLLPSPPSRTEQRVAFVVRTSIPSESMILRMVKYALELRPEVDFWVSVDETSEDAMDTALRIEDACHENGLAEGRVRIHRYCEADLEAAYPVLVELRGKLPNGRWDVPGTYGIRSMAWMFHVEALGHWFRHLDQACDYVWVFEDDVGYSGNVSELVGAYKEDPHDLISGSMIYAPAPPRQRLTSGWYWYHTTSEAFNRRVPAELRFSTQEFVQRISFRLLREADRWSSEGASAVSEMLLPTVALSSGMEVSFFHHDNIGFQFNYKGQLEEQEWEEVQGSGESLGRLYHPLKF
eukprot:CAMPEP_0171058010 /NCGR_PEP_ID=MMETSP0766_2-20121228/2199_1 /TAXON_ID=439317 /ORGANISM="Gambierdiscus australes, Strain CAWD 149" /LENGTH=359 /DNA_ID=CAMNT_0011513223 /DNA_START=50 /DNA_END=1129 /DNA_ORIENTATION=-